MEPCNQASPGGHQSTDKGADWVAASHDVAGTSFGHGGHQVHSATEYVLAMFALMIAPSIMMHFWCSATGCTRVIGSGTMLPTNHTVPKTSARQTVASTTADLLGWLTCSRRVHDGC